MTIYISREGCYYGTAQLDSSGDVASVDIPGIQCQACGIENSELSTIYRGCFARALQDALDDCERSLEFMGSLYTIEGEEE